MKSTYWFFLHTVGLLILYALVSLIAALKYLPNDPLLTLAFDPVNSLTNGLIELVVVGGLLGGGIYALRPPNESGESRLLTIAVRLWALTAILTVAAGLFGRLDASAIPLALLRVGVISLVMTQIRHWVKAWTAIPVAWTIGMGISAVCALIGLLPTQDLVTLASGIRLSVGFVLAALALTYWSMRRFSNVTSLWAELSLRTVAGLLTLAGALVTISDLATVGWIGGIVPLLYLIFAAHSYTAFSQRNATNTLAAHWTALGVLLLLFGVGLLGGTQAVIRETVIGTRLSDLQVTLTLLGIVAIILGVINQASAEMRGQNRRVTGLAPFWLVSFGAVGGGLALAGAGLVQVYLERLLGIDTARTQMLLAPMYELWIGGQALLLLGVSLYGLVWWLRRPCP